MKRVIDANFFPGFTRKSISFSIDDGNLPMDAKFKEIVEPSGFRGTFNLCSERLSRMSPEEYREFYRGHEIANHCKYHPRAFVDGASYDISDEPFDEKTADTAKLYSYHGIEGLYFSATGDGRWLKIADAEHYIEFIEDGHRELEEVFGKGSIRCFIWPFGQQKNAAVLEYAHSFPGYYGDRWTHVGVSPEVYFAPPTADAFYTPGRHFNLLEMAESYEALADDGKLKFFCFGIHSVDYEREGKWDELRTFAERYGSRPEDYYYATVGEIYDYAEATKRLNITDTAVENPTDIDLYIKIDGEPAVIKAGDTLLLG